MDFPAFSDALRLDLLAKLLMAVVLGGAIGMEREIKRKPAGLRTNILICIGATILTDLSILLSTGADGARVGDPARLAAQIVTGVGFIGAGTILHSGGAIVGLTSAATIWVVAALGMLIGAGHFVEAAGAGALVTIVLGGLGRVEHRIRRFRRVVHMTVRARAGTSLEPLRASLEADGMRFIGWETYDHPTDRTFELTLSGPASLVDVASEALARRDDVLGVHMS
jgi:putative Mg2+ transporter-C (MgtC) family protein